MILKKPTHDIESSQLLLETAAVAMAVLFPAARVPVLVLTSLSVLCKWAGNGKRSGYAPFHLSLLFSTGKRGSKLRELLRTGRSAAGERSGRFPA